MRQMMIGAAMTVAAVGVSFPTLAGPSVGYLTIEGAVQERQAMSALFMGDDSPVTLRDLVATLDEAASRDDGLEGVVIRLVEPALSWSHATELGSAIERVRESGKRVHLFTEIYGPVELVLGSYCDEVLIQKGGAVMLPGLNMQEMFLADTLKWVGVTPDFVQIGDYKGAKEMYANSEPSPEWNENVNGLLDAMYGQMRGQIMSGRELSASEMDKAMSELAFGEADDAVRLGVIDREIDRGELDAHLEEQYGEGFAWDERLMETEGGEDLAMQSPFEAFAELMRMFRGDEREITRDTIAVLHIDGPIMDGKSGGGGPLGGGPSVGALTIRKALNEIEDEDRIKGLIVRIDSPGGSAVASENIWQGIRRVAEKKQVWASVGSMAASGGYYVAVASEKIYVNPTSIVGSIGVVGGKLAMEGLFDKLKMNVIERSRGPMAGLMGGLKPWNEAERAYITERMTSTYDLFVSRVKGSRKGIDIGKTAEGRLFVGEDAVGLKMADKVGGLDSALSDMASALALSPGGFDVVEYPGPMSLEDLLKNAFPMVGAGAKAELPATLAAARELLGAAAFDQVMSSLRGLLELRNEPVVLVSPRVVIFR